jgi:hypothetical protein
MRTRRIYKYALDAPDVLLPPLANPRIVHVDVQGYALQVWVAHDVEGPAETAIRLKVVGTGHEYDGDRWNPVGSVQYQSGPNLLVWHVLQAVMP